jgi:hypothetical protein
VLLKKEGKNELKIANRFKRLDLKSSLSAVQSTKLIATRMFTGL